MNKLIKDLRKVNEGDKERIQAIRDNVEKLAVLPENELASKLGVDADTASAVKTALLIYTEEKDNWPQLY